MSQAATKVHDSLPKARHYWSGVGGRRKTHRRGSKLVVIRSHSQTFANEVAHLGLILIALQVLDGFFTGFGVATFGIQMEGNLLLRNLMESVGYVPALIFAKSIAILVISALCVYAKQVRWLKTALNGMIYLYLSFAILPWAVILGKAALLS